MVCCYRIFCALPYILHVHTIPTYRVYEIWEHFHPVKISFIIRKTIYSTFCTIAAESGIQLKPASNMQLGQQKPTSVLLRPQASHTVRVPVQQPNSQQEIPRGSTQQAKQAEL